MRENKRVVKIWYLYACTVLNYLFWEKEGTVFNNIIIVTAKIAKQGVIKEDRNRRKNIRNNLKTKCKEHVGRKYEKYF